MCQFFSWASALSPGDRSRVWARSASFARRACSCPVWGADLASGTVAALVSQHDQAVNSGHSRMMPQILPAPDGGRLDAGALSRTICCRWL